MARLTEEHQKEIDNLKLAHERAMADLKRAHEREVADLEHQTGAASSNSRLWWVCVNRTHSAGNYRDTSFTESESEDDDSVPGGIAHGATDYQARNDAVKVDIGKLCLDDGTSETAPGEEYDDDDSRPVGTHMCVIGKTPQNPRSAHEVIGKTPQNPQSANDADDRSLKLREVQADDGLA